MRNVSRQAVMLNFLSYADKELTNCLVLASDWLRNISVWFGSTKRDSEKNVTRYKITGNMPLLIQILSDIDPLYFSISWPYRLIFKFVYSKLWIMIMFQISANLFRLKGVPPHLTNGRFLRTPGMSHPIFISLSLEIIW